MVLFSWGILWGVFFLDVWGKVVVVFLLRGRVGFGFLDVDGLFVVWRRK